MNYDYSQMNEIIEKQYAKKKGEKNKSNWFWEESIKYGKGQKMMIIIEDEKALYLDEKKIIISFIFILI